MYASKCPSVFAILSMLQIKEARRTQYSFSDDPKNLECNDDYDIHVRDVVLKNGAGFIVVLAGKIMTMPGLPKVPAAESIDIDENENIVGIF